MQVDINEFIAQQQATVQVDTSLQQQHWNRMQQLMHKPNPKVKYTYAFVATAILVSIISIIVLNITTHKANTQAQALPLYTAAVITKPLAVPITTQVYNKQAPSIQYTIPTVIAPAPRTQAANATITKEANFYIDLTKAPEVYTQDARRNITIQCKQGTVLHIPASTILRNNVPVQDTVTIIVQEYYRYTANNTHKPNAAMLKYSVYYHDTLVNANTTIPATITMASGLTGRIKLMEHEDVLPENKLLSMQWITSDKYITDKRSKIDYTIALPAQYQAHTFMSQLAFEKDNTIIAGDIVGNTIVFKNIPKGEVVYFMSTGKVKDKYFSCSKKLRTGNTSITQVDFIEISELLYLKQLDDLSKLGK